VWRKGDSRWTELKSFIEALPVNDYPALATADAVLLSKVK
jgi:hypothetical protein